MRLFTFFAILVFLASCKKPEESLGENLQPSDDLLYGVQTDSIEIIASTEKVDSLRSDIFSNVMAGNYVDENFGVVKCRSVLQFSPDLTSTGIPENVEVYSVTLSLAYQSEAYGNNTPMYFEVNELLEPIYLDSNYYTIDHPTKGNTNLVLPGFETQVTRPEYAAIVSTDSQEYLEIPLQISLGERLIAVDSLLDDFDEFNEYFNGLVISSQTINGRVLNFSNVNSKIKVSYRYQGNHTTEIGSYSFGFTSSCEAYTAVDHQYFNSPIASLSSGNSVSGQSICYLQSAGGTRLRINIGDLRWLNSMGDIAINHAELIVPFDANSKYNEIDSLIVVYEKEVDVFRLTRDSYRNSSRGNFLKYPSYYSFELTSHVQSMLNNEIDNDEIVIVANPRVSGYYNTIGVRRTLIHGPEFSAVDKTQNMRLLITYTH